MALFRRRNETLNEQLLREAGLDPAKELGDPQPAPESPEPPRGPLDPTRGRDRISRHWDPGPRQWDAVVTARVTGLAGDQVGFVTLPNGDVIVEQEKGDDDLSPLADAVENKIEPPYRAAATRQGGDLWAVGAKRIQVAEFRLAEGDAVELSAKDGFQELRIDGEPGDVVIPALAQLGEQVGADYSVEAERIDGDFWEVKVAAL